MKKKEEKKDALVPFASGNAEKELMKTVELSSKDFYNVLAGGDRRLVPSARALQWAANKKNISTKVLEWYSDDYKAYVKVAGWIGDENNPKIYKEAIVEIVYNVEQAAYVLNKVKRNKWKVERLQQGSLNVMMPVSDIHKAEMWDYMLRKREFGIREALTKAEAIINRKLLSMEFREDEEIEFEKMEVEAVNDEIEKRGGKKKNNPAKKGKKDTIVPAEDVKTVTAKPETMAEKRAFLAGIFNHKEHEKNPALTKMLKGRDIMVLEESDVQKIYSIFEAEAEG
jgi:hypothetical protein